MLREFLTLHRDELTGNHQRRERITPAAFCQSRAASAQLNADYRGVVFTLDPVPADLMLDVDPQLMGSAVMNLLNNAVKFTRAGGRVVMRTRGGESRLLIEVEDERGGIAGDSRDMFEPFTRRRHSDQSGLGLGLSIARKAVAAHGGEIHHRNMPGRGCIFAMDIPLAGIERRTPVPPV